MEVFTTPTGEVLTVSSLNDLKDAVVRDLGIDVYDFIKGLCTYKSVGNIELDQVKTLQEELESYDEDITNLRTGLIEAKDSIDNLITTVTTVKRLNKDSLINKLGSISKDIENNESY